MTAKTKGVQVTLPKSLAERLSFLRNFHHRKINLNPRLKGKINALVEEVEKELKIDHATWMTAKRCPKCESGTVFLKKTRRGDFYGCSRYPECKHTESKPRTKES